MTDITLSGAIDYAETLSGAIGYTLALPYSGIVTIGARLMWPADIGHCYTNGCPGYNILSSAFEIAPTAVLYTQVFG